METDRMKFNSGPQKKGGKDTTRTILTSAGAVLVGAGGAVAATTLLNDSNDSTDTHLHHEQEQPQEPQETQQAQQAQEAQQTQQQQQQQQTAYEDDIQPVDTNNNQQTSDNGNQGDSDFNLDDVDPDLVAQEITAIEVDPNDVDVADVVQVDAVDVMYFEDGSEMPYATVHTPDGGEYLMVDVDNDLTFDVITDLEGNPVAAVEGNMTLSDVEDMMDESGLELAFNEEQNAIELSQGENPEDGIVLTDDDNFLAQRETETEDAWEETDTTIGNDDYSDDLAMSSGDDLYVDDIM